MDNGSIERFNKFQRTLEMPLINCDSSLILTWSSNCVISSDSASNEARELIITDTILYVPIVALSTQDNANL